MSSACPDPARGIQLAPEPRGLGRFGQIGVVSAGVLAPAETGAGQLDIGSRPGRVELRAKPREFLFLAEFLEALDVALERPDIVRVARDAGRGLVQPEIGAVDRRGPSAWR